MVSRNKKFIWNVWGLALIAAIFLLQGCSTSNGGTETGNPFYSDLAIGTFTSDQELRTYILDQYAKNVLPQETYGGVWADDTALDATTSEGAAPDGAGSYSQTNVQEEGVDEADRMKTDGRYLYIASDKSVAIVDAGTPSAMAEMSRILVDGYVDSMYLYDDLLVILYIPTNGGGNYWDYAGVTESVDIGFCYWLPISAEAAVKIVDVTDPATPVNKGETILEGNLISSRRIGDKLYMVQQFLPDLPRFDYYYEEGRDKNEVIAANTEKLSAMTLEDLIPYYRTVDAGGQVSQDMPLVAYDHFYKPSETSGGSVVTVSTLDLDDFGKTVESTGLIADAHTIYASQTALYAVSTRWNGEAYENGDGTDIYQTYLYKFSFTADGVVCTGVGGVNGKILNQFSLGEYNDVLRIATTNGERWMADGQISSNVYCLENSEGKLNVIGKIEGIAEGEQIYAARFLGDRGYLVTFVTVDPLFTLDMSDPYHPAIVGELKVPGYSDYIHPLSDDYILTIGQDVDLYENSPYIQGMQLAIFDVRDFANPKLLFKESIGDRGTYSEALYNHKAFTYWAEKNLLAVPVDLYEKSGATYPYEYGTYVHSGVYVYEISTDTGFSRLGTLITRDMNDYYDYGSWMRGVFIDDHVFGVRKDKVVSAEYNAMDTTASTLELTR